jgi:hypothetical protein
MTKGTLTGVLCAAAVTLAAGEVRADGLESPASGTMQLGRGGAWLARADDPLAAFFNPAAMVRNPSGVHLGATLMLRSHCYERRGPDGQPLSPGGGLLSAPDPVCAKIGPFPNPQIGATFHFAKRWAIGIAVVGPHKHGKAVWPDVIQYPNKFGVQDADHPSPQRYLLLEDDALLVYPTVSIGFAILKNLSIGAGFTWGVAKFGFSNMAAAISTPTDDFTKDIKAKISGFDGFIPGFMVSLLYSPTRRIDLAAYYRYSDAIRAAVDLYAQANYYKGGRVDEQAINDPNNITDVAKAGSFKFQIPMEARLGFRYHHPRSRFAERDGDLPSWVKKHEGWARDALATDLFDVEVDLTWSHNSAAQAVEIHMMEGIHINGTPGYVPPDASMPRQWRDVVGVRLGGEVVAIPGLLALRAGGFFESKGVDDRYLNLDFHQGYKGGVAGGVTVRAWRFDISAAYQHTFFGALDNGGNGAVHALSGDATTGYRTPQVVNGGRATAKLDEVALGATVHF